MDTASTHDIGGTDIRRLTPADAARYRELMLAAQQSHPDAFTTSLSERAALPVSWWESRLSPDRTEKVAVFGAFHQDRLIGVAGLTFKGRQKVRHKATLNGLYVAPGFRKRGIGKRLISVALEYAQGRGGIRILQLTVVEGNVAAISLYERCGFLEFGREPFAVAVDTGFAAKVHMWRAVAAGNDLRLA